MRQDGIGNSVGVVDDGGEDGDKQEMMNWKWILEGRQDLVNHQSAYLIAPNASLFLDASHSPPPPPTLTTLTLSDPQN